MVACVRLASDGKIVCPIFDKWISSERHCFERWLACLTMSLALSPRSGISSGIWIVKSTLFTFSPIRNGMRSIEFHSNCAWSVFAFEITNQMGEWGPWMKNEQIKTNYRFYFFLRNLMTARGDTLFVYNRLQISCDRQSIFHIKSQHFTNCDFSMRLVQKQ